MKEFILQLLDRVMEISLLLVIAWALILTIFWIEITEPMKTIALMVVSAYFGQKIPSNNDKKWI